MKKILYASAECAPFIKTGGLGTVVGSVPAALCRKGCDARVVMPCYECIDDSWKKRMNKVMDFPVQLGWRHQTASLYEMVHEGVIHYFIGNSFYFSGSRPYSDIWLDIEKFSFFNKAVLELPAYLDFDPDIIHCHDWHTGLIPVYLRTEYGADPFYQKIRTVMTIHNLKFQGIAERGHFQDVTGLPDYLFTWDQLEDRGCGNMLKGGIAFADRITTVSRTYAREIMEAPYGEGLEGILGYRGQDIRGIVNGIDAGIYDPAGDPFITENYDRETLVEGKKANKTALQHKTGLPEDESAFAIAIISRLTEQKGLDLLRPCFDHIFEKNIQLYVLGGGEDRYEEMLAGANGRFPDQIYTCFDYSDPLAKQMYAGCDAVLMPSLFEPCGLCQLMAFRYGTIPIVRLTGGLVDTVKAWHREEAVSTGFGFEDYDPGSLLATILEAEDLYTGHKDAWNQMAARCMEEDYSWEKQAEEYISLYEEL